VAGSSALGAPGGASSGPEAASSPQAQTTAKRNSAKRRPPAARAGLVSKKRRTISRQRFVRVRIRARRASSVRLFANGDFTPQAQIPVGLYQSYPNELERPLVLSVVQLLWDRGEANGYSQHMTSDPLPGTPPHQVLLHPAFGDHQVANVAADTEARSIGASAYRPAVFAGRSPDVTPLYGMPTAPGSGFTGSAIVYWDGGPLGRMGDGGERGTPAPPTANVPPRTGKDPHSYPRSDAKARLQKSEFLKVGGTLFNPCGIGPCYADGFTGP